VRIALEELEPKLAFDCRNLLEYSRARVSEIAPTISKRSDPHNSHECAKVDGVEHQSDREVHSLSERELPREVHRVRRSTHVGTPCVRARLASTSGLLLTTEGTANLGS